MKTFLLPAFLFLLMACAKDPKITSTSGPDSLIATSADSSQLKVDSADVSTLKLETFGFPPEVSGCSCYFGKTKADFDDGKYVYIDDYGNKAFVKTGGKLITLPMEEGDFDPENFVKTLENKDVSVTIKGKKVRELEEVMMFEGTMTVETKDGRKAVTTIYGECGC